jgi:hypothetical protein
MSGVPQRLQVITDPTSVHLQQVGQHNFKATAHSQQRRTVTRGSCADGAETVTGSAQTEMARRATRNWASTRGVSRIDDTNDLRKAHACRRWVGVPAAHCMLAGARDFVTKSEPFAFGGHQRGPELAPVANAVGPDARGNAPDGRFRAEFRDIRLTRDGLGSRRRPMRRRYLPGTPPNR